MRNPSQILQAQNDHLSVLMALFSDCTDSLLAAGIKQWHHDYPKVENVAQDILKKEVFVWLNQKEIEGTITLNAQQDPQYQQINWGYEAERALVIHRLAVDPLSQGQGIGKALCLFAETYARQNNFSCIRLDAYSGNPSSNRLYEKLGYHKAEGYCWFHDNELPFYCWEKRI